MKNTATKFLLVAAGTVLAGFLTVSCEKKNSAPDAASDRSNLTRAGSEKGERDLTAAEMDTLRAWKKRLALTRDEYLDDRGGVVGNEWADVWYPAGKLTVSHGMYVFLRLDEARERTREVFGGVPTDRIEVHCIESMEQFERGGTAWWHYSRLDGDRMNLQPVPVLSQRGLLDVAPRREFYRWAIGELSTGKAPVWLQHGFASYLSGESRILQDQLQEFPADPVVRTPDQIESALKKYDDKQQSRMSSYSAFQMTRRLVDTYGVSEVGAMIAALGTGSSMDGASRKHLGVPWSDAMDEALSWSRGWSR